MEKSVFEKLADILKSAAVKNINFIMSEHVYKAMYADLINHDEVRALEEIAETRRRGVKDWQVRQDAKKGRGSLGAVVGNLAVKTSPPLQPEKVRVPTNSTRRRRTRDPKEQRRRWDRRDANAYWGFIPGRMASGWTRSEMAVLRIYAERMVEHGSCRLSNDEIAGRAGVSVRMVQNTRRKAVEESLISVEYRRVSPTKNLPNVIKIVSPEWLSWLNLRQKKKALLSVETQGCKNVHPTPSPNLKEEKGFRNEVASPVPNPQPPLVSDTKFMNLFLEPPRKPLSVFHERPQRKIESTPMDEFVYVSVRPSGSVRLDLYDKHLDKVLATRHGVNLDALQTWCRDHKIEVEDLSSPYGEPLYVLLWMNSSERVAIKEKWFGRVRE